MGLLEGSADPCRAWLPRVPPPSSLPRGDGHSPVLQVLHRIWQKPDSWPWNGSTISQQVASPVLALHQTPGYSAYSRQLIPQDNAERSIAFPPSLRINLSAMRQERVCCSYKKKRQQTKGKGLGTGERSNPKMRCSPPLPSAEETSTLPACLCTVNYCIRFRLGTPTSKPAQWPLLLLLHEQRCAPCPPVHKTPHKIPMSLGTMARTCPWRQQPGMLLVRLPKSCAGVNAWAPKQGQLGFLQRQCNYFWSHCVELAGWSTCLQTQIACSKVTTLNFLSFMSLWHLKAAWSLFRFLPCGPGEGGERTGRAIAEQKAFPLKYWWNLRCFPPSPPVIYHHSSHINCHNSVRATFAQIIPATTGKEILNSIFGLIFKANNHTLWLMGLGTCWVAWGYPGLLGMLTSSWGPVQATG